MRNLIKQEFIAILSSGVGLFFALAYLLSCGLILWLLEGAYNLLDAGYASLDKFFALSSILFLILVPALTMGLIAGKKKYKTLDLVRSYSVTIHAVLLSKIVATWFYAILIILPTLVYSLTFYLLGSPVGNIDIGVLILSYLGLIALVGVFISVGVFASSLSSNQIIAFIFALLLNLILFYGFDLLGNIFYLGGIRETVLSVSLQYRFIELKSGILDFRSFLLFVNYASFAYLVSVWAVSLKKASTKRYILKGFSIMIILNSIVVLLPVSQIDFTKDKRYTISNYSKQLMSDLSKSENNIKINIYLEGNLNYGFQRLRIAIDDLLTNFAKYSNHKLEVIYLNPSTLGDRDKLPHYMARQSMPAITLNEVDRNGKVSQQFIYPYAEIIADGDTARISLWKNIKGNTAEENLNASAENLEFEFVDALRLLTRNEDQAIAFIEGHGELPRPYVYDAEEALAKYFTVNRGQIGQDVWVLDDFKVVIIAGATQKYSETEKYILDQYLMKGGRILWLMDGAYLSRDDLMNTGRSASMKNETNLDDLLFNYGVRINSNLLQDNQCASILINQGEGTQAVSMPWYYSPLLLPSPSNAITKNIAQVKAEFVSSISLLNNSKSVNRSVLLTTSNRAKTIAVPETIDLDIEAIQANPNYFNEKYLPVALALNGSFNSVFTNRMIPDSVNVAEYKTKVVGSDTKMIVVASSDIIRNEVVGQGSDTQVLPMGYDKVAGYEYGNKSFIVNAVNWLANDDDWLQLRAKTCQLNLLDKKRISENRNEYVIWNILLPVFILAIILAAVNIRRRFKYAN